MALIVQKFGGTSVRTPESRKAVLEHILQAKQRGFDVVVVVSAMGRRGDPYATDTLIDLLEENKGKVCLKTKDLIMSCGEIISAAVMASYIEANGLKAEAMTGFQAGILTNDDFGNAEIICVNPDPIKEKLREGKVAIVAGFQGRTENGEITTLGRGGSDTTAVVLGGYLKADLVEIYTDVPGIAVTDPRIVPNAPFIPKISYDEVIAMAQSGAKVIHPRAVKAAKEHSIALKIKSTFEKSEGTRVGMEESSLPIFGISIQRNLTIAKLNRTIELSPAERKLLQNVSTDGKIYTGRDGEKVIIIDGDKKEDIMRATDKLFALLKIFEDMSKVTVVYKKGLYSKSIKQEIIDFLAQKEVHAEAGGDFDNSSTVIVKDEDGDKSVKAIYNMYF